MIAPKDDIAIVAKLVERAVVALIVVAAIVGILAWLTRAPR